MPDPSPFPLTVILSFQWTTTETIYLLVILALLFLAAITTSSESALFSLNPKEKEALKNEGTKTSKIIVELIGKPRELIALLLISINFVNVGIVILSTLILNKMMHGFEEYQKLLVEIFGITLVILIIGEVIPKIYGANNALKVARWMAYPIDFFRRTPPISWLKALLVRGTSFIGKMGRKTVQISTKELEYAIAITTEEGNEESENRLLEGIVRFGKIAVDQIMTPRIEIEAIADSATFEEVRAFIVKAGYSRMPVYHENMDNVVGILFAKDLLPHLAGTNDFDWKSIIRKPYFVPENKKIDDLLQEFRNMKMHMAVVVDEYGGASGIITLEDVLEEIVGDITDEFDDDDVEYKRMPDGSLVFEGRTALKDFYKILEIEGSDFESKKGDAETLGGFLVEVSGRIMKNKEHFDFEAYRLTVVSSDKRRVKWINVKTQ
ncbi:MAG: gliding motility-associated protein GldE [Flavobacteriales bacterium]